MTHIVTAQRMSYGSASIASLDSGKTVFVEGLAPGDVAEVEITEEKPRFARARVVRLIEASELREQKPACKHPCSGCPWLHITYHEQCVQKRALVIDALRRNAHFDVAHAEEVVAQTVACKREWGYRNKLEFAAQTNKNGQLSVGFYEEGTHCIRDVDTCPIAVRSIEKAPKALRGALRYLQGSRDLGIYRVGVRASLRTRETEIALWTPPSSFPRAAVAKTLQDALKASSIVRVLADPGKARKVKKVEVLAGRGCWHELLGDYTMGISAPSFFQVNTAQAERMIALVLEGLGDVDGMWIADLYAGAGTFSLPLSQAGASVVAIELAGSSIRDLRRNIEQDGADVETICGDVETELPQLGQLDAAVVDPPRAGLTASVIDSLACAHPNRLVYVSCDPQTWARDIARLEQKGFTLVKATPLDMFPQTYHIETVSVLEYTRALGSTD